MAKPKGDGSTKPKGDGSKPKGDGSSNKPKGDGSSKSKRDGSKAKRASSKPKSSEASVNSTSSTQGEKRKLLSRNQANKLLKASDEAVKSALRELEVARELAERAGLTVDAPIVETVATIADETNVLPAILRTTGGHSNTDHVVKVTGDARTDRIAELKRNLIRRARAMQPESKGEKAWDKPRVPGERRRRIIREKDTPEAPPEPPRSGYVIFIGQMTTKIRHDRPNERHQQTKVVQEISRIWRLMPESEREYYNNFAQDAYAEYQKQHMEYRATGHYVQSQVFQRIEGAGLWLRTNWQEKNGLEREISSYEKLTFPPRPPEYDEEYNKRLQASIRRRKLKLKGLLDKDGNEIEPEAPAGDSAPDNEVEGGEGEDIADAEGDEGEEIADQAGDDGEQIGDPETAVADTEPTFFESGYGDSADDMSDSNYITETAMI